MAKWPQLKTWIILGAFVSVLFSYQNCRDSGVNGGGYAGFKSLSFKNKYTYTNTDPIPDGFYFDYSKGYRCSGVEGPRNIIIARNGVYYYAEDWCSIKDSVDLNTLNTLPQIPRNDILFKHYDKWVLSYQSRIFYLYPTEPTATEINYALAFCVFTSPQIQAEGRAGIALAIYFNQGKFYTYLTSGLEQSTPSTAQATEQVELSLTLQLPQVALTNSDYKFNMSIDGATPEAPGFSARLTVPVDEVNYDVPGFCITQDDNL